MTGIFMYGAEPAGGLFAARSQEGGSYVSVLAWGQRAGDPARSGGQPTDP